METPQWIRSFLNQVSGRCAECHWLMKAVDIQSVGVGQPLSKMDRGPMGNVAFRCPNCGQSHLFVSAQSLSEILQGVEWFHEQVMIGLPPPSEKPLSGFDLMLAKAAPKTKPPDPPPKPWPSNRPSRRRNSPTQPITDKEVQRFLKVLHRTSLKRRTKSWKQFLRKLGIPVEEENPDPKEEKETDED